MNMIVWKFTQYNDIIIQIKRAKRYECAITVSLQVKRSVRPVRKSVQARCSECRTNTSTRSASSAKYAPTRWLRADFSPKTASTSARPITSATLAPNAPPARITSKERWVQSPSLNLLSISDMHYFSSRLSSHPIVSSHCRNVKVVLSKFTYISEKTSLSRFLLPHWITK